MRIAHISDLHCMGDVDVAPSRYFNKRATGYVNLRFRRKSVHKRHVVARLAAALSADHIDHVVITGDVSNLALETEFEVVRDMLATDLGLGREQVSLVPGNHDLYTRGSARSKRFAGFFEQYMGCDIGGVSADHPSGPFPYVRLRGNAAIIGLSSAVPMMPMVAAGRLGEHQLAQLAFILHHPEVRARRPVILIHHPPHNPRSLLRTMTNGLHDAPALLRLLGTATRDGAVVLHGHLHERMHVRLPGPRGDIDAIGATSASLLHDHPERMAGYNWYEIERDGLAQAHSFVLDEATDSFVERQIPLDVRR